MEVSESVQMSKRSCINTVVSTCSKAGVGPDPPGLGLESSLGVGMGWAQTVAFPLLQGYQKNGLSKYVRRGKYHLQ